MVKGLEKVLSLQYHMMLIGQVLWAVKELFLRSKDVF